MDIALLSNVLATYDPETLFPLSSCVKRRQEIQADFTRTSEVAWSRFNDSLCARHN